jgi:hypothetical protein
MARKIELKVVKLNNGNGEDLPFSYAAVLLNALRFANPNQGLTMDEVLKAVDAQSPITKAIESNAGSVTLSEEQWRTIVDKLDKFPFAIATQEIAEFGLAIRNAPEIGRDGSS